MLKAPNPREAVVRAWKRKLAQELQISEASAEALLQSKNPGEAIFQSELDAAFKRRLLKFRRKLDLSMDTNYSGQEGQIFESEVEAGVCLKRWFKKALHQMPESVRLLEEAYAEIQSDLKLRELIEVVRIHERGEDWILRDFEFDSIPLSKALGDPKVSSTRARLVEELQAKQHTKGTLSKALGDLLKKLGEPPSANVHWSPTKKKCVVIDMQ